MASKKKIDDSQLDVRSHNRRAWDRLVQNADRWTVPVDREVVAKARSGDWQVVLTPTKPVPPAWFPSLDGLRTLCLASGGGQQSAVLAAAGANVVVLDQSPEQLRQDRFVADRDGLSVETIEGDMGDLSVFSDESFGLIFHPCSNTFAEDVIPVWKECARVLRPGGVLLAGFCNPVRYLFEDERAENGSLRVLYRLPYSDLDHLDEPHIRAVVEEGRPLEFGHTLQDQIGGQLQAGLLLTGFYEDSFSEEVGDPISRYMQTCIATRALKPG